MFLSEPWCKLCFDEVEVSTHVLRDCSMTKAVWSVFVHPEKQIVFFGADLKDWITLNMWDNFGHDESIEWSVLWATSCHFLWRWRNIEIHNEDFIRPYRPWHDILTAVSQYRQIKGNRLVQSNKVQVQAMIAWKFPSNGWISLNSDGASRRGASRGGAKAGCGGLFRDEHGKWLCGFSKCLGYCNAYVAVLWGVYEGLKIARDRGYSRVELNVDSKIIVDTLRSEGIGSVYGWRLIQKIRSLLTMDWEIKFCHSYREANACADALAKMGCDHESFLMFYEHCPAQVNSSTENTY